MTVCFVAGRYDPAAERPLVVAANRDEFYDRQGFPPRHEEGDDFAYVAPRDPRAGGTWFGFNEAGLVVALTNRPASNPRPDAPSRGGLVRSLLAGADSFEAVRRVLRDRDPQRFNPFVLLVLGPRGLLGRVHTFGGEDRWLRHGRGHFFLSNRTGFDFFEEDEPQRFPWTEGPGSEETPALMRRMRAFCRRHDGILGRPYLCGHGERAGTLSSAILVVDRARPTLWFDFAQGAPCRAAYRPRSFPPRFGRAFGRRWDAAGSDRTPGRASPAVSPGTAGGS